MLSILCNTVTQRKFPLKQSPQRDPPKASAKQQKKEKRRVYFVLSCAHPTQPQSRKMLSFSSSQVAYEECVDKKSSLPRCTCVRSIFTASRSRPGRVTSSSCTLHTHVKWRHTTKTWKVEHDENRASYRRRCVLETPLSFSLYTYLKKKKLHKRCQLSLLYFSALAYISLIRKHQLNISSKYNSILYNWQ